MKTGLDIKRFWQKLTSVPIFKTLKESELQTFVENVEAIQFEDEEIIALEGDFSPSFFIILEGQVAVTVKQKDREVYICSIGEGDIFGEAAIFLKVARTATVKCKDNAVVLKVVRQDFIDFMKKEPRAGNKVLMLIVYSLLKKLREANQELAFERQTDIDQDDIDAILNDLGA